MSVSTGVDRIIDNLSDRDICVNAVVFLFLFIIPVSSLTLLFIFSAHFTYWSHSFMKTFSTFRTKWLWFVVFVQDKYINIFCFFGHFSWLIKNTTSCLQPALKSSLKNHLPSSSFSHFTFLFHSANRTFSHVTPFFLNISHVTILSNLLVTWPPPDEPVSLSHSS